MVWLLVGFAVMKQFTATFPIGGNKIAVLAPRPILARKVGIVKKDVFGGFALLGVFAILAKRVFLAVGVVVAL